MISRLSAYKFHPEKLGDEDEDISHLLMLFINETYLSLRILSPYALTSGHRCQLSPLHQSVSHQ